VVPREFVDLTLSFDHDVVDGAPAARFAARLRELLESASVLDADASVPSVPAAT
jgi:pyruvate/2-oxoglutarate dehydrogenase complex dihydrolipoamide acyltransferase (E2) component